MSAVTIRNISDETHRALKSRAVKNARSTEAEIRAILDEAVRPADRVKLGSLLHEIGRKHGMSDLIFDRDKSSARAAKFK